MRVLKHAEHQSRYPVRKVVYPEIKLLLKNLKMKVRTGRTERKRKGRRKEEGGREMRR